LEKSGVHSAAAYTSSWVSGRLAGLPQQYLSLIGQQYLKLNTMILLAEVVGSDLLEMLERANT
jgi:hypothetical protein